MRINQGTQKIITMLQYPGGNGVYVLIGKKYRELLGNHIVFNYTTMIIKRPTLDNKKTYSIKTGHFAFSPRDGDEEKYFGKYLLEELDEDTFRLNRIEDDTLD